MNDVDKQILEFIESSFYLYNIDIRRAISLYEEFFGITFDGYEYYTFEEDDYWKIENYPEIVEVAALVFGVNIDDILSCNEELVDRFYKSSYDYFFDAPKCINERIRGAFFRSDTDDEEYIGRLLGLLTSEMSLRDGLDSGSNFGLRSRYDYESILQRMLEKLKEEDKIMPGLYHHGQTINYLSVDTDHFISYEFVDKYITSFVEIVERIQELFYKIVEGNISEDEKKEYNFLVLVVDARLIGVAKSAFYNNVIRIKKYINKTKYDEITSYIRFDFWKRPNFQPWRCIEFTKDYALAQELFNLIPEAKPQMRQFAMNVKYFMCEYSWTDSPIVVFKNEEVEKEECEMMGMKYIPPEERPQIKESIYLEKSKEEIGRDEGYSSELMKMAAPPKLGGISIVEPEGRAYVRENPMAVLIASFEF